MADRRTSSGKRRPPPVYVKTGVRKKTQKRRPTTGKGTVKTVKAVSKKKKVKPRFHAGTLIAALITLFMFMYIAGVAYNYINRESIATIEIKNDVIDTQKGTINAIIIRHEEILTSNGAGEVNFIINDKERIKKGTSVLQIRNTEQAEYIEKNLGDINESLNNYQNRRGELSWFYSDAININSQIKESVEKNIHKLVGANTSEIYSMKESITNNINLRNQMLLTENKGSLTEYLDDKTYYENELIKYVKNVESTYSGIISYSVDNLESVIKVDDMESLTKEMVAMKPTEIVNNSNKLVEANVPVCKIVTSSEWYIAGYVDNEYADGLKKDDVKKLYIINHDSVDTIEMTVHYVNKGEAETYMIFKSSKNIIDYMDIRNVTFKLIDTAHRGLKVPNTAIVDRTFLKIPSNYIKDNSVLRQMETGNEKIAVTVSKNAKGEEGYTYVLFEFSKFALGDVLVGESEEIGTHKILEGDMVSLRGVYKTNNQTARFICIDDEDIVSAGGYSILDSEKNPGLNPHDRIVVDGSNIVENQIIN